jgi:hypothetical protein
MSYSIDWSNKAQLSSDRASYLLAKQMRLILRPGAYWLLLDLRAAIPSRNLLRHTEFATIRLRLLKVAGRVIEGATRIRIALPLMLPRGRDVQSDRAQTATVRTMSRWARTPETVNPSLQRVDRVLDPTICPTPCVQNRQVCSGKSPFRSCIQMHKVGLGREYPRSKISNDHGLRAWKGTSVCDTRVGAVLRRAGIHGLPLLINVLRGAWSLIDGRRGF